MRRWVSLWFPHWQAEHWRRPSDPGAPGRDRPLAVIAPAQGGLRVTAVDSLAAGEGIVPGLPIADARALLPYLAVREADPCADAEALARLAGWCGRYSPLVALDGADGLLLDITGCAHLFGGEDILLADLTRRLTGFGLTLRAALADTPAAAWAWAHAGPGGVLPVGVARQALAPLPVAALRLPDGMAAALGRLGLRRIGDLMDLPRAPLTARFGDAVARRLDLVLGRASEPIAPLHQPAPFRRQLAFAEPIGTRGDIDRALEHLLDGLLVDLDQAGQGLRRCEFSVFTVDGGVQRIGIGTARPSRERRHVLRLFAERLEEIDPGFGIEVMTLEAPVAEILPAQQAALEGGPATGEAELARLVDRLQQRLGRHAVVRLEPVDSHIPERAVTLVPALAPPSHRPWMVEQPRPLRLLPSPELIEVTAMVPDDPPLTFRWRTVLHRVAQTEGPERLSPEWWRDRPGTRLRDYYWVEDLEGRRYWLYREGAYGEPRAPRWYMHGLF
ncbi:MAG: DNA polymerase Y family protein [Alphaproteobacteria bacterium]|nr:DNA polymerase Y family protein [Alphaproteobacteria bacterium]MBU1814754.1 DNA polymerase Y family protein [Alphaproteobacteria bacterium]